MSNKPNGTVVMADGTCPDSCTLFQPWLPCAKNGCCEEGKTSLGYSKADGPLGYCINGQLQIATSLTDEKNCTDPFVGANNTNPPTWTVQSLFSWLTTSTTETVMTIFGDIFGADGKLDCEKLVAKCGLVTKGELDALTEEVNAINQGIASGNIFNTTAASSWWTNLFNTTATQTWFNSLFSNVATQAWFNTTLINSVTTTFSDTFEVVGGKISINCAKLIEKCGLVTSGSLSTDDFTVDSDTGVVTINAESACDATLLTQAQVDAATSIKSLVCLTNPDGSTSEGAVTEDMLGGGSGGVGGVSLDYVGFGATVNVPEGHYYVRAQEFGTSLSESFYVPSGVSVTVDAYASNSSGSAMGNDILLSYAAGTTSVIMTSNGPAYDLYSIGS